MPNIGCSDGTREGFANQTTFRRIAACEGGWTVPGMGAASSCALVSGNSSTNVNGTGCAAADLCAADFHICGSSTEVAADLPAGQTCAAINGANLFFATEQSGPGCKICNVGACSFSACNGCQNLQACENDIFGCGTMGVTPDVSCGVLNEASNNLCGDLPTGGWSCPSPAGTGPGGAYGAGCTELVVVTKSVGNAGGGVLCCAN
jgi:hypothetical protein